MALDQRDLHAIKEIVSDMLDSKLLPIAREIAEIDKDVSLLAKLNLLDEIRKAPNLRMIDRKDQVTA